MTLEEVFLFGSLSWNGRATLNLAIALNIARNPPKILVNGNKIRHFKAPSRKFETKMYLDLDLKRVKVQAFSLEDAFEWDTRTFVPFVTSFCHLSLSPSGSFFLFFIFFFCFF
jgi:hypothetical protein